MLTSMQRYTMAVLVRETTGAPPFADEYSAAYQYGKLQIRDANCCHSHSIQLE